MNCLRCLTRSIALAAFVFIAFTIFTNGSVWGEENSLQPDARRLEKLRQLLATTPQARTTTELARVYAERVKAARQLHDPGREFAEIEAGLQAVGTSNPAAYELLSRLAEYHADRGEQVELLQARQQAVAVAPSLAAELIQLSLIASTEGVLGERTNAASTLARAQKALERLKRDPAWQTEGERAQAFYSYSLGNYQARFGSALDAEAAYRACLTSARAKGLDFDDGRVFLQAQCSATLGSLLLTEGRLEEATILSIEIRELAREYAGKQHRPVFEARLSPVLVQVEIERGHLDSAIVIIEESTQRMRKEGAGEGSLQLAALQGMRATIEMLRGDWQRADEIFEARRQGLLTNADQARRLGIFRVEWGYALLRLGQNERALEMLQRIASNAQARYGDMSLAYCEARGFLALGLAANGQREQALQEFQAAVPRIIDFSHGERSSTDPGLMRTARLNWILEGYLALLADMATTGERSTDFDPMDQAFRLADLVRGSTVQRALANAASRVAIEDRSLAGLSRQYFDQQRERAALSDGLTDLLARGRVASMDGVVARIRTDLETLQHEQERVRREIELKYPDFASLLEPKPPGIADVKRLLRPGETLVSVLVGYEQTYIWAIPQTGGASFVRAPIGAAEIARQVGNLRRTLNPAEVTSASLIPAFDFDTSNKLYAELLGPVEPALQDARLLIVVPHAELSELPFAVLTTAPFRPTGGAPHFDGYADAPWLIKRLAISQLPSTTALISLRQGASKSAHERAFVGFADPVFAPDSKAVTPSRGFWARSRPLSDLRAPDDSKPAASQLNLLQPLPETADEVREIGRVLGADEKRDLFLGKRASKMNVKSANLDLYGIVMFATHGLMPGDLAGLSQPALALSSPALTGNSDDGLLQMDEILGLKLNADWVVLSACNTASAARAGEAISGLGRAFFFAGARALLVTDWAIETTSARLLTTSIFRNQTQEAGSARAKALQEASLALMQQRSDTDAGIGYAHPMFWAPFVLVGDGD